MPTRITTFGATDVGGDLVYPQRSFYSAPCALLHAFHDGGRRDSGLPVAKLFSTGDCVIRAVAITTERSYAAVYEDFRYAARRNRMKPKDPAKGVVTDTAWFHAWMVFAGFSWTPVQEGTPLRHGSVPMRGRHVVELSKHVTAIVDNVILDTYHPAENGDRPIVDGFWTLTESIV